MSATSWSLSSVRPRRAASAFLMLTFLSPLFASGAQPDYPRLSDNTAVSPRLELRKLLHGQVDGMFVAPASQQVIAGAGGYLWRFSAQGELLETLYEPQYMFASGIAFGSDHYVDWVHTGDRQRKAYGLTVNGNALSQSELYAALDAASVVEFARRDKAVWAFLWADGKAWKMDITRHDRVDTNCGGQTYSSRRLGWDSTCLEGYKARPRPLREIEPESFARDTGVSPRVEVLGFDRRVYHLEGGVKGQLLDATVGTVLRGMGYPGGGPERFWFGDARVRLNVDGEHLGFTAFVPRQRDDYAFHTNMSWWEPSTIASGMSPWFTVRMRDYMDHPGEEGLLRHYVKDIGLFAIRPRGIGELPVARREVPAWRPVFEGPSTRRVAVSGRVEMVSGGSPAHRWLRSPEALKRFEGMPPTVVVEALWPDLHQLPRALAVEWGSPWDEDSYSVLRIQLQEAETRRAFQQLRDAKATIELVVQVPDLEAHPDRMAVSLRAGGVSISLASAQLSYLHRPATTREEQRAARRAANLAEREAANSWQQPFHEARQAARERPASELESFLQRSAELATEPKRAGAAASTVVAAYAELLVHYNVSGSFAASSALMRHYLAQVHPHIGNDTRDPGQAYNVGVLASQSIAFALHAPQYRDLLDAVMQTLIGPGFDPSRQTNATLMYNLACYYAAAGDKPRLLESVEAARRLGKPASQFMEDTDFKPYWQDEAFRDTLSRKYSKG